MRFVDFLVSKIVKGFNFIGDMIFKLMEFLATPLGYLLELLKGIFYFIYQLFNVVVHILMIFVALFQFLGAIVVGFFRTIFSFLTINYDQVQTYYPSTVGQGITSVIDLLSPTGFMTIVPYVLLAFVWLYFVIRIIKLFGTGGSTDD